MSWNLSRNFPRATFKESRSLAVLTDLRRMFHSLAALTEKEFSKMELMEEGQFFAREALSPLLQDDQVHRTPFWCRLELSCVEFSRC